MKTIITCLSVFIIVPSLHAQERLPIIDMHMHALAATTHGPPPLGMCIPIADPFPAWDPAKPYAEIFIAMHKEPACDDPVWSPMTDEELRAGTVEVMERNNIFGVLVGTHYPAKVGDWMEATPGRFIPGLGFRLGPDSPTTDSLRTLHAKERLSVLAILADAPDQYAGVVPEDGSGESYLNLAKELDIPVGIQTGTGPPGIAYFGYPGHRAKFSSALTIEELLVRHPGLRVYIMHAGFPFLDDLLALLYAHPQVYVELGVIIYSQPRAVFYRYLRGIVEAGFGNRVMFGSDQMVWPGVIERSIEIIEEAPFLSEQQKRDIFYNNAARFLRLTAEEIARHHGNVK
jgi:uncharacterized protein